MFIRRRDPMERLEIRMERFEIIACVFVGIPCVAALLYILPIESMIGGIFGLSCFVMPFMILGARFYKAVSDTFFKKDEKDA